MDRGRGRARELLMHDGRGEVREGPAPPAHLVEAGADLIDQAGEDGVGAPQVAHATAQVGWSHATYANLLLHRG